MRTRQAVWALIVVSTLIRFALAIGMGGFIDESYYLLYARNLDWAFFDHPPMVGVVSAVGGGLAESLGPLMGLRFGFIVMFAGSSWLMARLTARWFGDRAAFLAVLVLNSTLFYGLIVGTTAGPDGPLLFFWLLTLDRLAVAFESEGRTWPWVGVGLAWGAAMLSKYHAVLLPVGVVLFLVIRPSARRCLLTPGPYLATLAGLAAFSPVIFWNAGHGWASFLFHGRRSGGFHGFRPEYVAEAVVGQIAYLFPWVWLGLVAVLIRLARRGPRNWTDAEAFLACQAVPVLVLFMSVSTFTRIMVYWPMIGSVALMPLLGRGLSERLEVRPRTMRACLAFVAVAPVVLAGLFVIQANFGLFQDGKGRLAGLIPAKEDPTVDTIRWDQIARELKRRGLTDDPKVYLFTDNWRYSAELALATNYQVPVLCFHRDARSFTFWSRPADWVGRDGIFVRVFDGLALPEDYAPWFTRIESLDDVPIMRADYPMQTVRLFRCVNQTAPFPFGYAGAGPIPRPDSESQVELGLALPVVTPGKAIR